MRAPNRQLSWPPFKNFPEILQPLHQWRIIGERRSQFQNSRISLVKPVFFRSLTSILNFRIRIQYTFEFHARGLRRKVHACTRLHDMKSMYKSPFSLSSCSKAFLNYLEKEAEGAEPLIYTTKEDGSRLRRKLADRRHQKKVKFSLPNWTPPSPTSTPPLIWTYPSTDRGTKTQSSARVHYISGIFPGHRAIQESD